MPKPADLPDSGIGAGGPRGGGCTRSGCRGGGCPWGGLRTCLGPGGRVARVVCPQRHVERPASAEEGTHTRVPAHTHTGTLTHTHSAPKLQPGSLPAPSPPPRGPFLQKLLGTGGQGCPGRRGRRAQRVSPGHQRPEGHRSGRASHPAAPGPVAPWRPTASQRLASWPQSPPARLGPNASRQPPRGLSRARASRPPVWSAGHR